MQLGFFLAERLQAGPGQVGLVHAAMNLSGAVAALGYRRAWARALPQRLFVAVFGLMALGLLLLAHSRSLAGALVALLVFGLGMGWMIPNQNVWLVTLVPAEVRGRAVGGLKTARQIGQVLSPLVATPLAAIIGLGGVFTAGAAALGAVAVVFALSKDGRVRGLPDVDAALAKH